MRRCVIFVSGAAGVAAGYPWSGYPRRLEANPSSHYVDDAEPAACVLGQNCTDGGIPAYRGLCVVSRNPGAGKACWDVCNPNHAPESYQVNDNTAVTMSYAGMVETVRAGLNPMVRCPNNLHGGDPCPPGEPCTYEMRRFYNIPKGRGMCVIDANKPNSRACMDMCDTRKDPSAFTFGTPAGTASTVETTRANVCPRMPWAVIILTFVGIVGFSSCCIGVLLWVRKTVSRRSKSRNLPLSSAYDQEADGNPDLDSAEVMRDPLADDVRMGSEDPSSPQNEYARPGRLHGEPDAAREPDLLPPEPPRVASSRPQESVYAQAPTQADSMPPMFLGSAPSSRAQVPSGFGGHHGSNSRAQSGSFTPGPRIPGLSEPNLLPNIGALQAAGPQQFVLGATHGMNANPLLSSTMSSQPGAAMPSFHTKVPSSYIGGASPPASMKIPGPAAPGQQWFTTLQRR